MVINCKNIKKIKKVLDKTLFSIIFIIYKALIIKKSHTLLRNTGQGRYDEEPQYIKYNEIKVNSQ